IGRRTTLINEEPGSKMILATSVSKPLVKVEITKGKSKFAESYEENLAEFIDVKGMRAQGNRLSSHDVVAIELLSSKEEEEEADDTPVPDENTDTSPELKEEEAKIKPPITLEITNPEDVEIDDKGQIGLF